MHATKGEGRSDKAAHCVIPTLGPPGGGKPWVGGGSGRRAVRCQGARTASYLCDPVQLSNTRRTLWELRTAVSDHRAILATSSNECTTPGH